jgi:hypothetical protein
LKDVLEAVAHKPVFDIFLCGHRAADPLKLRRAIVGVDITLSIIPLRHRATALLKRAFRLGVLYDVADDFCGSPQLG